MFFKCPQLLKWWYLSLLNWYVAEPENDVQYILEQIKHDNNCSFPDLEYNWKATTQFRLKSIQTSTSTHDILNNWSNYKLPLGYRLVIFTLF